jgi:hypothetical protein
MGGGSEAQTHGEFLKLAFIATLRGENTRRSDGAPRPRHFRRMAPPLTGRSLIPQTPTFPLQVKSIKSYRSQLSRGCVEFDMGTLIARWLKIQ